MDNINKPLNREDYECMFRILNYVDEKRDGRKDLADPCYDCKKYCKKYGNLISPKGPLLKIANLAFSDYSGCDGESK